MSTRTKFILLIAASAAAIIFCADLGSVSVPPDDILSIISNRLFGTPLNADIPATYPPLVLDMRFPRVLCSYITGAALAVSGGVMQSVLQNPLASPFGLGVSAGAGLGAALVIVFGFAASGVLNAVSLAFALATVLLVAVISAKIDRSFSNITIVLVGMIISLFCSSFMSKIGRAHV